MDECQLYSTLLELKSPWEVERVSLDSVKETVEIYITHVKGSKLLCPMCRKERMVYDHLREHIRDLDSIEVMTFIHASPPGISCNEHGHHRGGDAMDREEIQIHGEIRNQIQKDASEY